MFATLFPPRALFAVAFSLLMLPVTAQTPNPSLPTASNATLAQAYAPTGKLRAVINLGNPVLAFQDPPGTPPRGPSVDLANELAKTLNLPLEMVVVASAGKAVEVMASGQADLAFLAIDPERGNVLHFSPPYVTIEGTYAVRESSPIKAAAEVDRANVKVMVGQGSVYDLHLSRTFKQATILKAPTSPLVVQAFLEQNADVAAGVRQQIEADLKKHPGLRMLPGHFMLIEQAMAVPRARSEAVTQHLRAFVEVRKADGFVEASLKRHQR
jgi:ABC-type amino acid transport substrate-binding protein